jgi:uridine kinase
MRLQTIEGMRSYQQTLCLILIRAAKELFPQQKILIDHSLGNSLYCEFEEGFYPTRNRIRKIQKKMMEIAEKDELIKPVILSRDQILEQMFKNGEESRFVLGNPDLLTHHIFYTCGEDIFFLGYPLLPKTGFIKSFHLKHWHPGFLLMLPPSTNLSTLSEPIKEKKIFHVFHEYRRWGKILGIEKVADINQAIDTNEISHLIKIAEGLHEKKIAEIADYISHNRQIRIVLVAGPSSSGKTTFIKRLQIQQKVIGMNPFLISLDDYFYDRDLTPKNEKGEYDFESTKALNVFRLNHDLMELLSGKTVRLPKYDFKDGKSMPGPLRKLQTDQPILIEGMHCLNNQMTSKIPRRFKFKIYVSALTQLNVTNHLRIPTSDVRLLRRLIRDCKFRGNTIEDTLQKWSDIRQGEESNIFPFQEQADIIFNSSLMYEIPVLRYLAEPLLEEVSNTNPVFSEKHRILQLLNYFTPQPPDEVPLNSILREFIGGSSFHY